MPAQMLSFRLAEDGPAGRAGQVVTMSLSPADVHDPTEDPTFLRRFKPFRYRADEASRVVLVSKDEDQFRTFHSDDAFRRVKTKISREGTVPEVDPKSALDSYKLEDEAIGSFISDVTALNATGFDPRQASLIRIGNALGLSREVDFWTFLTTTGNWNANNRVTLLANEKWNGGADSDPNKNLQDRIEASGQEITGTWMNQGVGFAYLRNAKVKDDLRFIYGDSGVKDLYSSAADDRIKTDFSVPGIGMIHIVKSRVKNETTGLMDYCLGNDVVMLCQPEVGDEVETLRTYRRQGVAAVGYEVREYRVEGRGPKGGTMLVATKADAIKSISNICGGLIKAAKQ